jgi:hypothetical protein
MKTVLLAIAVVALSSCAPTSGAHREYYVTIDITNNAGPVTLTSPLKVDSISAAEQTSNPVISPTTRLQLTEGGSTAAGEASTLTDVASKWLADQSKKDSENPITTTTTNNILPNKEEAGISPITASDTEVAIDPAMVFNNEKTYNFYNVGDGGRQAWRIPEIGTSFGKTIKLTFESGYTVLIPDTSVRFALKNGLIYRPGDGHEGDPTNSIQTSHGGVYLYAPTGDKSTWVKISY